MKCAICSSVAIPGILPYGKGAHLPLEVIPPNADEWWYTVQVHVCPICVETHMRWCIRHPAVIALDATNGAELTKRHKRQPWHIPVYYVPVLYGALLLASSRRRVEWVDLWCAERGRLCRGGAGSAATKPKQARKRTTKAKP